MQVDWAGDTASVIDTDTGEIIPAYVFVATLPYSGYSYVEAFFSMNQECWTAARTLVFVQKTYQEIEFITPWMFLSTSYNIV